MPWDADGHLIPGVVSAVRPVPAGIPRPEYVGRPGPRENTEGDLYSSAEVERIRAAGRIAARAIEAAAQRIRPGVTTEQLDVVVHDFIVSQDAYPSTVGYRGYPKAVCTSVNEVICHGIPDDTVLRDGDIVNLDVTAFKDGVHGDLNRTFVVGEAAPEVVDLVTRTEEAMRRGIRAVAPGRQVNVVGRAIESYAKRFGYGVVRDYTGHGVGRTFHSGLVIPHYDAAPLFDDVMQVGMVFTIEPMLTLGGIDWDLWPDDWTVVTRDRSWSAQFEHTIVVTETGADILTLP
jgi:methionyl aminopeptidase